MSLESMDDTVKQTSEKNESRIIEFKGTYHQGSDDRSMVVLVQFDGVLLHVWHQSDPFYRIVSCDVFQIAGSLTKRRRCIKLSNGDRILTDDIPALRALSQCHAGADPSNDSPSKSVWVAATLGFISLLAAVWWFSLHTAQF